MKSANKPYIKEYNAKGNCTNPLPYESGPSDRRARRALLSKTRFIGNGKNYPITVFKTYKLKRVRQVAYTDGIKKVINHSIWNT